MKIAVSVPDDIFADAERLAKRLKTSRSQVFSHALREYVARHDDRITEALNDVVASVGEARDDFVSEAARRTLKRADW